MAAITYAILSLTMVISASHADNKGNRVGCFLSSMSSILFLLAAVLTAWGK